MDFQSVKGKSLNFDINKSSAPKEVKKELHEDNEKKSDLKKCPVNPCYWQNAAGIKTKNISFGQETTADLSVQTPDDKYIDEQLKKIQSVFYWIKPEDIDLSHKREVIKKLASVSAASVENYVALSSLGIFNNEDRKRYDKLVEEFISLIPNFSKENHYYVQSFLQTAACSNAQYELFSDYIKTILKKENVTDNDKILWLYNSFKDFSMRKVPKEEIEKSEQMLDGYIPLFAKYDNPDDKLALIKMQFAPEETSQCCELIESDCIESSDLASMAQNIVKYYYNYGGTVEFKKMLNDLSSDSEKALLYKKLTNKSFCQISIPVITVLHILKGPVSFYNKLFDKLLDRTAQNEYVFNHPNTVPGFLQVITEDNYDDFLESTKDMPASSAVYHALNSINPKTKLYDRKIGEKITELESRGISNFYSREIAFSFIDGATGEFSPIADEIFNFIMPQETDKNKLHKKFMSIAANFSSKVRNLKSNRLFISEFEISDFINCVKNKEGAFEEKNLHYVKKFFTMRDSGASMFSSIPELVNSLKDENGVVKKSSFLFAVDLMKKSHSLYSVSEIIKTLNSFPQEKQTTVINTITNINNNTQANLHYFPALAKFCFDKDGNEKPENISFVKELSNWNKNPDYDDKFFDMCSLSKENKDFSMELIKSSNPDTSLSLYRLANLFDKYKENNVFPEQIKRSLLSFVSKGIDINLFDDTYTSCLKNNGEVFDKDMFDKITDLMKIENGLPYNDSPVSGSIYADILNDCLDVSLLSFKDKINILNTLKGIRDYTVSAGINDYDFLDKTIADIDASMNLDNISLPIDENVKAEFLSNVLKSNTTESLTSFEKTLADSISLLKSFKYGLPILYPREDFLKDLTDLCEDESTLKLIQEKTGISPIFVKDEDKNTISITGYNGIINLNELNLDNPKEKQIYNLLHRFFYENQVISGNTELDKQLNYIIKACPEFINTIGKKQHGTHEHTLDIHCLLVLANSISNPAYLESLNSEDRSLLKIAAIFHDLVKKENEVDKGHQNQSSLYARSIVKKFFNNPEKRDRLYEIIQNHHWLEEYSTASDKELKAKELAFRFRRPNDFELAKIMARADLQSVSDSFYEDYKNALAHEKLVPVDRNLDFLYATGNAIFSDYIVAPSKLKLHTQQKDGIEYSVINFNEIASDEDMSQYGFLNGVKKKDIRLLVHMVDSKKILNSLNTVKLLTSPFNGGVLSESLITPDYQRTYCDRKYGVLLSQINTNIVNENSQNQGSGTQKDFKNLLDLIYGNYNIETRANFRHSLLENLGINSKDISDKEYGEFYRNVIASKTSVSQIPPHKEFKIGTNTFTGQDLIDAIIKYQDSLIDKTQKQHNEIVGYTPKIQAVIAKAKTLDKVPDELLKFAHENNYPVILI